jgi:hypothetical protein
MSSPCNREQYRTERPSHAAFAGAPPRGAAAGAARSEPIDEWELLRATPDYDEEEMRGVGLPLYLPPSPGTPPAPPLRLAQPEWLPLPASAPPPGDAPQRADLGLRIAEPGDPSPEPEPQRGQPQPAEAPARWPEAHAVAMMATDLYDTALANDTSLDVGPLGWLTIRGTSNDTIDGWDDDSASASELWAFLPDEMLGGDRGHDLLGEALQAGERAGLLDGSEEQDDRAEVRRQGPTDLLDEALAAGERSGLMDGLA